MEGEIFAAGNRNDALLTQIKRLQEMAINIRHTLKTEMPPARKLNGGSSKNHCSQLLMDNGKKDRREGMNNNNTNIQRK